MSDAINIPELVAKGALDGSINDFEEICRAISVIIENDSHTLRALQLSGPDDQSVWEIGSSTVQKGLEAVKQVLGRFPLAQVFVQLNPTRLVEAVGNDTTGMDRLGAECQQKITRRKWLLVDIDSVRGSGTNSTDLGLSLVAVVAQNILEYLRTAGWKAPIVALSGNGIHLLYRVDLPADEASTDLVRKCLRALAERFRTDNVAIDRQVFDLPRLTRMYGTVNRKGPSTPERPQRRSRLLFVPESIEVTPGSFLERVALEAPESVSSGSVPVAEALRRARQLHLYPKIPINDLIALLHDARPSGHGWVACCPAHSDGTPSLSISERSDHTILLYCHAGCEFEQIVKSLGLRPSQLFGTGQASRSPITCPERCEYPTNPELTEYAQYCRSCLTHSAVEYLAGQLGVTIESLLQLGIGWSVDHRAWTIPERRSDGGVIGIQLRFCDGKKTMITGSHRGLILPGGWWSWTGSVVIPEGASDVAACLSRGIPAIGRPAAASAPGLAKLLANIPDIVPIVFGENDQKHDGSWPGLNGANSVARQLAGALGRDISVAFPPAPHKDIRDFFLSTQGLIR